MPNNSRNTIKNRLVKAMLEIAESPTATVQERLDAVAIILKAKELAGQRDRINPRKQPKLDCASLAVLGTS
jgi:hypothetical protein